MWFLTDIRASYSSDWGDYVSFAKHMRDKADADGSDLLLIDTGDRVEGNSNIWITRETDTDLATLLVQAMQSTTPRNLEESLLTR